MIEYKIEREKEEIYKKELCWYQRKVPFIVSGCTVPFIVYFLIIGFVVDKEALSYGFGWLAVSSLIFIKGVMNGNAIKRELSTIFDGFDEIYYSIELYYGVYCINNITKNYNGSFPSRDVKKVIVSKNIIIVNLAKNAYEFFPKRDDILKLFEQFIKPGKK